MLIERLWVANDLRNFQYLVACSQSGEALAVDPLDARMVLSAAKEHGYSITQILNTHEHLDHTAGNAEVVKATGAKVLAHAGAAALIGGVDRGLARGDVVKVGKTVELEALDTPGHTLSHLCLLGHGDTPALFCGDTLFNAGAGNCHNGGDSSLLYETFVDQLAKLPDSTRVYPGHEYMVRNLGFTIDREPGNADAVKALAAARAHDPGHARVTTLAEEKRVNAFMRLSNPQIIAKLREKFPEIGEKPDARTVFVKLRELRNKW